MRLTPKERFELSHIKTQGCWNWIATKNHQGYGYIFHNGKNVRAHSTNAENMHDRNVKGRHKPMPGEQNGFAKLSNSQVASIRQLKAEGASYQKIAIQFGISKSHAHRIVTGQAWLTSNARKVMKGESK